MKRSELKTMIKQILNEDNHSSNHINQIDNMIEDENNILTKNILMRLRGKFLHNIPLKKKEEEWLEKRGFIFFNHKF